LDADPPAQGVNIACRSTARGVRDVAFHKRGGLRIEDRVRSRWVYRKLRNFRAGIEADISCLKRAYGSGPLHLARARPLQGLRLVSGGRLQSRPLRPPPADLTLPTRAINGRATGTAR